MAQDSVSELCRTKWVVARVFGVPVELDGRLLHAAIVAPLVVAVWLHIHEPSATWGTVLVPSVFVVAGALLSLLVHEFAHLWVARRRGVDVTGATLWVLGGYRRQVAAPSLRTAAAVVAAGPLAAAALAIALLAASWISRTLAWQPIGSTALGLLGYFNVVVASANLLPAEPFDGGTLLTAWRRTRRGVEAADAVVLPRMAGQAFALLVGVAALHTAINAFVSPDGFALLVGASVLLGLFVLLWAAQADKLAAEDLADWRGPVGAVTTPVATVSPKETLREVLDRLPMTPRPDGYPVVSDHGRLVGLVLRKDLLAHRPRSARVARVMLRRKRVPAAAASDSLQAVVDRLRPRPRLGGALGRGPRWPAVPAVVLEGERPAGVLGRGEVAALSAALAERRLAVEGRLRRGDVALAVAAILAVVVVAALLAYPPFAVIAPTTTTDLATEVVADRRTGKLNGRYLEMGVVVDRRTTLGTILAVLDPEIDVVRTRDLSGPPGVTPLSDLEHQRRLSYESRVLAAAAAARAAGLPVPSLQGSGARVYGVVPNSAADGVIAVDDVVVEVDRQPVRLAADLRRMLDERAGRQAVLTLERNDRRLTRSLIPSLGSRPREVDDEVLPIGVYAETRGLGIDVPVLVREQPRQAGPSGGLALALVLADFLLAEDLARGRTVAATGTIDPAGRVGRIGAIQQKAISAKRDGTDVFLVPIGQAHEIDVEGLCIREVPTLAAALTALRAPRVAQCRR